MKLSLNIDESKYGVRVSSYVGFLLGVLGLFSWAVGQPLLIPSVGPSAFALATLPEEDINLPERVIAGQFIGAAVGLLAYFVIVGHSAPLSSVPPFSILGLRRVIAPFVAVIGTTVLMYAPNLEHPPAYAATLIMAHGLLSSPAQIAGFAAAVVLLVAVHEIVGKRLDIWDLPYPREQLGREE
ncbi:MAG TPA: HPP family protein [Halococcus sp.]|nr:HPP family protein [Halococcus sp.]